MTAVLRSEWIKLRTVRIHWVLAFGALGFPLVVVSLASLFTSDLQFIDGPEFAGLVGGTGVVSAMLLAAMAAIALTGEYAHGTVRPTYAATPSRVRVVAGKVVVATAAVLAAIVVIVTLTWIVGASILAARDQPVGISADDGSLGALVGLVVLAVLVTWFGFGLGLLIRNAPATVSLLLLWPLLVESILALVLTLIDADDIVRWLPYQAAIQTVSPYGTSDGLGRPGAWLWFGAISWVLIVVGVVAERRRDA